MDFLDKLFGKKPENKEQAKCPFLLDSDGFGLYCDNPNNPQRIPLVDGGHIDRFCRGSLKTCPMYTLERR